MQGTLQAIDGMGLLPLIAVLAGLYLFTVGIVKLLVYLDEN